MSDGTQSDGTEQSYAHLPGGRAKWMRRAVLVIACLAVAILFFQALRPQYGWAKDNIPWRTNLPDALAEAKKTGKPVLVDFSASWCEPCQLMKHNVWPDAQVEQLATRDYIPVLLDADSPAAEAPSQRYSVEYIPAVFILDSDGKVIRRGDLMSRDAMLSFLRGDRAG